MVIEPLKNQKESLVDQVQEYLLDLMRNGTYKRGEKLPTEIDLAIQLGVARGTLREALNKLELNGVIQRKHGIGTFITKECDVRLKSELEKHESVLDIADRSGIQTHFLDLSVQEIPASEDVAFSLRLDLGRPVTCVERIILADDNRVAFMRDITPIDVLSSADIDETFRGSVLDLIRRKQGLQVSRANAKIEAINADPILAKKLLVEPGWALLVIEELLFDKEERPIEFSYNYFVPSFFQFNVSRYYSVS
jgi:GntR family transcriptional regulator